MNTDEHYLSFLKAIKNNDVINIGKYLNSKFLRKHVDKDYALRWACVDGATKSVEYLLNECKADACTTNNYCLRQASYYGFFDIVKLLVEHGANVHVENDFPISIACSKGFLDMAKFLLKNGADIHAENGRALLWACESGHYEVVKFLFENGITKVPQKAFFYACLKGSYEIVHFLISKGADATDSKMLTTACVENYYYIAKLLIENGSTKFENALLYASIYCRHEIVKLLVEYGATITEHDLICATGNLHFFKYLLQKVNISSFTFETIVKEADEKRNFDTVRFLLHDVVKDLKIHISKDAKQYIAFADKMENKRQIWAVNTIGSWWIPICYDLNRECGKRMMEKSWKRVEEMYENFKK